MQTIINVGQNYRVVGGSDRYMLQLETLLEGAGIEAIPFSAAHDENQQSEWSGHFPKAVNFSNPGLHDVGRYIYNGQARKGIDAILRERSVALAHLHIYYGQLSGSILKPLVDRGIPIVQTLHEYKLICPTYSLFADGRVCEACKPGKFYRAITRRCNRGSLVRSALSAAEAYASLALGSQRLIDHFITVSDFQRQKVIEHGIAPDRVTTVHNYIDVSNIEVSSAPGEYVLYLGRLERIKGLATLLSAIEPLRDVKLVVAGDGTDRNLVAEAEQRLGKERVDWRGFVGGKALGDLIRGARFLVAPSEWYETFGLILIEAFAHGRAVISSRMGGMTEVVTDGTDGLLFTAGDVESLREKIDRLWHAPQHAIEMGMAGRRKVETSFSPQLHLERLLAVYRSVGVNV